MEELWKDIDGFPNYEISNTGKVRVKKTGLIRKPDETNCGYYQINLSNDTGKHQCLIHRLVANAFIPNDTPNMQVNHIDGDKKNNRLNNLEWCTRTENMQHAIQTGLFNPKPPDPPKRKVRIEETGDVFDSIREAAKFIDVKEQHVWACLNGKRNTRKGFHFAYVDETIKEGPKFLYDFQYNAVNRMMNGCILNGSTGSGKSRTGLYYYFKENGGCKQDGYIPMDDPPQDLYIITTAMKRDKLEWDGELANYLLSTDPSVNLYQNKVVVDSWQNIQKYKDVTNSFFIFDEDKVTGKGAWAKAFLKIARANNWIILSASSGDVWSDYTTVFIANGFYRNITDFNEQHVVFSRFTKYPKIDRYLNEGRLIRLRNKILIDMDDCRTTVQNHEDIYCDYNPALYKSIVKDRWNPWDNKPIKNAAEFCYSLRKVVNSDESRQMKVLEIFEKHPRLIIFYSFDYELDILKNIYYGAGVEVAEYNGHMHQPVPKCNSWVYLVNYTSGAEAWNCITTDTIIFYSQNYSYKTVLQATGRIDRLNSPYEQLYYYHLKSRSGIDLAISKALRNKKKFNEGKFVGGY